jgi:O-antigen/teichoic acid export membrane protein
MGERGAAGVLKTTREWVRHSGNSVLAVLDQGCFATAHFILNVLLARWLEPGEYGAFVVAYSVFLLPATLHTALLTDPALVFLPGRFSDAGAGYRRFLTRAHWWIGGGVGAMVVSIAVIVGAIGDNISAKTMALLGLGAPGLLLMWYARRLNYARQRVGRATLGSATYLTLVVAGTYGLQRSSSLSAISAVLLLVTCSVGIGLGMLWGFRPGDAGAGPSADNTEFARAHWWLGRWGIAIHAAGWIPVNLSYSVLPLWWGLEGSAGMRALLNLMMPVLHAASAVSGALVPDLAAALRTKGRAGYRAHLRATGSLFLSSCAVYVLVVIVAGPPIVNMLYGGRYVFDTGSLIITSCLPVLASMTALLSGALRARERFRQIFTGSLAGACVAFAVGLPLTAKGGITGALVGQACAYAASSIVLAVEYLRTTWVDRPSNGRA